MVFKINLSRKPIVLIDCSYYIFYRYFATKRWMLLHLQREPVLKNIGEKKLFKGTECDPIIIDDYGSEGGSGCGSEGGSEGDGENDDSKMFLDAFQKYYTNDVKKIKKAFSDNIYMCIDCLRDDIWRKQFYPEYKGSRKRKEDFNRDIFDQFKKNINTKITQISHENLESDDIIAIIHKNIRERCKDMPIVIITNDNDYLQLSDKNTRIVNMLKFEDIRSRCKYPIETQLVRKIVKGDNSDNIRKVNIPRLTKDLIEKIVEMTEDERVEYMKKNNTIDRYNLNKKLISFTEIPQNLVDSLRSKIVFEGL